MSSARHAYVNKVNNRANSGDSLIILLKRRYQKWKRITKDTGQESLKDRAIKPTLKEDMAVRQIYNI